MPATLTNSPSPPQNPAENMRANPRRYARYVELHLCWDEQNRLVSFADCENAESERVASKLGNGGLLELDYPLVDESLFREKHYANTEHAQDVVDKCLHAEDARPSAPLSYL